MNVSLIFFFYRKSHYCCHKRLREPPDLEESFRDVFLGANKIIDDGFIEIDGKKVGVDIYLGGDHKVS